MLSLHQLRCFLATYEHGSLTAAAEELGYAQPSVSEQIRGLEKTLRRRSCSGGSAGASSPPPSRDSLRPHAERDARRRRGGPAGGAERDRPRDRHHPVRHVRHRPAVRRRRAGRRRARRGTPACGSS